MRFDPKTQAELSKAAAQMVIERIAEQAAENEQVLTETDQQRLASSRGQNPDPFFEARMVIFLHRIVEQEQGKAGRLNSEMRLADVLRYAGEDRSYAIELVRQVLNQPEPAVR